MSQSDAVFAGLVAFAITALLTPLTARFARRIGAVDAPRERGLAERETPLLGGLAMFAGAAATALTWLPGTALWHGILLGSTLMTVVGAIDDRFDIHALLKLAGQIAASAIVVHYGVVVHNVTVPFMGAIKFGEATGDILTCAGLVAVMNVVNLSDGVDGLAAGVCAIVALAFAVIAFDLGRESAGVLAALTAGAALGFLVHNFYPASVFMGDCGSNLLGLLMGCVAVQGAVKSAAVVSLVVPLALLAVPFLDTTFVILKRIKYRRPVYAADAEHLHHRLARIGYSQRRTVLFFYAWTLLLAGFALALRFVPYSDHHGHLRTGGTVVMIALAVLVAGVSVYLVYVLEILKFKRINAIRVRRLQPEATDDDVERDTALQLETGEFTALSSDSE